eukprot:403331110
MRYKFAESQRKEKLKLAKIQWEKIKSNQKHVQEEYHSKRESAKMNVRMNGENAVIAFGIRNIFEEKSKSPNKGIKIDPEMELLERGKLEIQHYENQQHSELDKFLGNLAEREHDKQRRWELEEQYKLQMEIDRMRKKDEINKKFNYLNKRDFYKEQVKVRKNVEVVTQEKVKRKQVEQQTEEELLEKIKQNERKQQIQEANVRQKHKDFKQKVKNMMKEQENQVEMKRQHIEQLKNEKDSLLREKQRQLTEQVETKKEQNKEKLVLAQQQRQQLIMKLIQQYKDKEKEIEVKSQEYDIQKMEFQVKMLEYNNFKKALRKQTYETAKQIEQGQKDKTLKEIEESEQKLREILNLQQIDQQKKKQKETQKDFHRKSILKKNQEFEQSKKLNLLSKIDGDENKLQDIRLKNSKDQRLRMEYDKLKRKEKEDSVRRLEKQQEYEREKKLKDYEEERELREKLKKEREEIDNYKRQMRENAKVKKDLIVKSFETLQLQTKSPVFISSKASLNINQDSYRSQTGSIKLPEVVKSPKEFSKQIKTAFLDDNTFRKFNSPSTLTKSINSTIEQKINNNQQDSLHQNSPGTSSHSKLLKSVGSTIQLRLPKAIQRIASLEAKYFSQFSQNSNNGLLDQYLEQQGGFVNKQVLGLHGSNSSINLGNLQNRNDNNHYFQNSSSGAKSRHGSNLTLNSLQNNNLQNYNYIHQINKSVAAGNNRENQSSMQQKPKIIINSNNNGQVMLIGHNSGGRSRYAPDINVQD